MQEIRANALQHIFKSKISLNITKSTCRKSKPLKQQFAYIVVYKANDFTDAIVDLYHS